MKPSAKLNHQANRAVKHRILIITATAFATTAHIHAQGPLTPPGAPAPTQKSLQEIWDKIGALEAQNAALQTQNQNLSNLLMSIGQANGAIPWQITTVDSTGNLGSYGSLAITPDGQPAISYWSFSNFDLKYAVFNGSIWTHTTVDGTGDVGLFTSLAFTPGGQPAISYYDDTNGDLKYAIFDGSTWTATTVDSTGIVGTDSSLAFTPDGQPAISYYDFTNRVLKYAIFDGVNWTRTIVDSTGEVG